MGALSILIPVSAVFAAVPAVLFFLNLRIYRRLPLVKAAMPLGSSDFLPVSVLIPARDEQGAIVEAIRSALANTGIEFEVVVLDDHSTDQTAALVETLAASDGRVRLERSADLPRGWCGKQHACWQLSRLARYPLLVFVDADVRLSPDALQRISAAMATNDVPLLSGFPRQVTKTPLEKLLIPLMHFVLLGFLPVGQMRASRKPAYAAGCGQLFAARADVYASVGGHAAIRKSMHDGVTLPQAYRRAGQRTDLFDATDIARCRMYQTAGQVWRGLGKNAIEGLAKPALIVPATVVLVVGQILPFVLLVSGVIMRESGAEIVVCAGICVVVLLPRIAAAVRFRQPFGGALLHPLAIVLLLVIQWQALLRHMLGRPSAWRGRNYAESL